MPDLERTCGQCRYYGCTVERPPVHSMGGRFAHICYRRMKPRLRISGEEAQAPPACRHFNPATRLEQQRLPL